MSLHYVLDGYNIIKQLPTLSKKRLKDARSALLRLIKEYHLQGSKRNKVTIVFDGSPEVISSQENLDASVIFAKEESADDKIKRMVEKSSNPKSMVLVSDDKELRFFVRALGAKLMYVVEFLSKAKTSKVASRKEGKEQLSSDLSHKITAELKKIWLK